MALQDKAWLVDRLEEIRLMNSYAIEDSFEKVAERPGISPPEVVRLNLNENLFIPKQKILKLLRDVAKECDLRIYPQEEELRLKKSLADYLNVTADHIIVGNGGDELIQQIARLFLEVGDEALSVTPTFSMYGHIVGLVGGKYLETPLNDEFTLDAHRILSMATPRTRMLFLCSPNNPTANQFDLDAIRFLVEEFPGLVIIDEAYVEFAEYSVVPLLGKFENMIVLRTFSKAFGLAGLRLGYAAASLEVAEGISKAQLPFPLSSVALRMGLKMLSNVDMVKRAVKRVKIEREKLIEKLNGIDGVKAFPSQTNFVLFQTDLSSGEAYRLLLRKGILVKNFGHILHLTNCLRTTVGLPTMNIRLLTALEEICGGSR